MQERLLKQIADSGRTIDPIPPPAEPVCEYCGGTGLIGFKVPVEDERFGKAYPCWCQREKNHNQKVDRIRALSALHAYADKTFESFVPEREKLSEEQNATLRAALEVAYRYAVNPEGWILLKGTYGTGKTHLAAAIANYRVSAHAERVIFITVPDLLDHLRSAYAPTSESSFDQLFEEVKTAPLLILDDLGAESSTPWAMEKLYALFNHRHVRRLPTVITTNQDTDLIEGRIRSRLLDHTLTQSIQLNVADARASSIDTEPDLYDMGRYVNMTFEKFEDRRGELNGEEYKALERVVNTAKSYVQHQAGWLILTGAPGTGKTHLAAAIAHEIRQTQRVIITTSSDLLDYLRYNSGQGFSARLAKRLNEIKTIDVLIVDDLHLDSNTSGWVRERLYDILLYRFDRNLPTLITMNILAEIDLRLRSRLENRSRCTIPAFKFPPYKGGVHHRVGGKPSQFD
jgi:DNA replication protein DnaC